MALFKITYFYRQASVVNKYVYTSWIVLQVMEQVQSSRYGRIWTH